MAAVEPERGALTARIVADEDDERDSTGGGGGETDEETRDGAGVCPSVMSGRGGAGGGMDPRGTRSVGAEDATGETAGNGVGLRIAGIDGGVGLRITGGGVGVVRLSGGGTVDLRVDGGSGVMRLSGGGTVDLRPEGGSGVMRFSGGGTVDRRADEGRGVERDDPASSSNTSDASPLLRGSTAGRFVPERRDDPCAELIGVEASGGVFPIVTSLTLVEFLTPVRRSRHEAVTAAS